MPSYRFLNQDGGFGSGKCMSRCGGDKLNDGSGGRSAISSSSGAVEELSLKVEDLNLLTASERERIYEDVHGISSITEETPEFVSKAVHEMRIALAALSKKHRKVWERALYLRPNLANDDKLHMMFLRAERFDPQTSAAKLCRHFEHKLELFGDSKLVKKITLDDLSENAQKLIHSGSVHFLLNQDRAGRAIYLMTGEAFEIQDWVAHMQYCWYTIMSELEDNEEVQKRGVIRIFNLLGKWKYSPTQVVAQAQTSDHIISDWPFRPCGFHLCLNNVVLKSIIDAVNALAGREFRIRERSHFGSQIEVQYALMTFGIDLHNALSPGRGVRSADYLENYLQGRQRIEAEYKAMEQNRRDSNPNFVDYPWESDVLMGRGMPAISWIGNQRMQQMINMYADSYRVGQKRIDKTMTQFEIVQRIQVLGGRFLERKEERLGWEVVSDHIAKEKVSQGLRNESRKRQKS